MVEPYTKINTFLGIDNTSDQVRTSGKKGAIYLRGADNIDIDDEGMPHRRDGYGDVVFTGTGIHSVWSDPSGKICLFVHGNVFKRLPGAIGSLTTPVGLIVGIDPTDRMAYVDYGDKIYFSNNTIIGYINTSDGNSHPFPLPEQTFKELMIGGHILEIYRHRLYSARDRILTYSDPTVLERKDNRHCTMGFPNRITMVKSVVDGVYIGVSKAIDATGKQDSGAVYFMAGNDYTDFTQVRVSDVAPIEGTAISVEGDDIGRGGLGKTAYWTANDGIYKGFPGGMVVQLQDGLFTPEDMDIGTAIYTTRNGYGQYLAVGQIS